jgi:hsp70-interacting protein
MKLWPAIIAQLSNEHAEVRKGTAWVCGTAVQNNPKAQQAVSAFELAVETEPYG